MKKFTTFAIMALMLAFVLPLGSCSSDDKDEPKNEGTSIYGTWVYDEADEDDDYVATFTFKFNKDQTGTYTYHYESLTKASVTETMTFDWKTTVNSDGDSFLKITNIEGDRIEPFDGTASTYTVPYEVIKNTFQLYIGSNTYLPFQRK